MRSSPRRSCRSPHLFPGRRAGLEGAGSGPERDRRLTRLGYHEQGYTDLFAADYHIGKRPSKAVDEYRRRSPVWNVGKLKLPLMITSTTNDPEVNVVEVEQLIVHLKAAGKSFEHKICDDAPGGHSFEGIDTTYARNVRKDLYTFLEKHLK